jgi:hypothetical protein
MEPTRFYFDMIRFPFTCSKPNPIALSALIILSQVANAAGFAYELAIASRTQPRKSAAPVRQNAGLQS